MSCPFRVAASAGTFMCKITQSECQIKVDTEYLSQETCDIRYAFKDLKI